MLCTVLWMAGTRTQIYLTPQQRAKLEARMRRDGKSLDEVVREAVDSYLADEIDEAAALEATFGALPDLQIPSRGEWERTDCR